MLPARHRPRATWGPAEEPDHKASAWIPAKSVVSFDYQCHPKLNLLRYRGKLHKNLPISAGDPVRQGTTGNPLAFFDPSRHEGLLVLERLVAGRLRLVSTVMGQWPSRSTIAHKDQGDGDALCLQSHTGSQ